MRQVLLLSSDAALVDLCGQVAREQGWRFKSLPALPPADKPPARFDLVMIDVRPVPGSALAYSTVIGLTLQPGACIRCDRVLCVSHHEDVVGRITSYPSGASGYLRIHPYASRPEPNLKARLQTAMLDALSLPVYEVLDFHDNFPDLAFYSQALESLQVPVVILSGEGSIEMMNLRALALFNYPTHMVIRRDWTMLLAPTERPRRAREVLQRITSGFFYECSVRFLDRQGREFTGLVTSGRVFPNASIILTIQDLTEMEALQRQLLALQRMEAVERVVAGVTHEFNNLLTAILGHAEMLALDLPAGTEYQKSAEIIRRQAETARQLTDRLLGMSGCRQLSPEPVACGEIVRNTLALLARSLGPRIHIDTELLDSGDIVEGDAGQLQQVLVNLCLNARDAIADEGAIYIRTQVREIFPEECRPHHDWSPGMFVEISIRDTGCGIPDDVLEHVFEPFFTTKPVGSGTGLGLSVVRAIVKSHGGHVVIESAPGHGTQVLIRLPQSQAAARPGSTGRAELPMALPGSGGILVVDDDRAVLIYTQQVLERAGYKLWLAGDGKVALDLFDRHRNEISLIIVDLIMPVMPGQEVIREIRRRNAEIPIIVCTGFAPRGVNDELVRDVQGFLRKPYRQRDLLELVHEVILG